MISDVNMHPHITVLATLDVHTAKRTTLADAPVTIHAKSKELKGSAANISGVVVDSLYAVGVAGNCSTAGGGFAILNGSVSVRMSANNAAARAHFNSPKVPLSLWQPFDVTGGVVLCARGADEAYVIDAVPAAKKGAVEIVAEGTHPDNDPSRASPSSPAAPVPYRVSAVDAKLRLEGAVDATAEPKKKKQPRQAGNVGKKARYRLIDFPLVVLLIEKNKV